MSSPIRQGPNNEQRPNRQGTNNERHPLGAPRALAATHPPPGAAPCR